ncbi:MAG: DNA translocase FtsK 4TM domain-containing protein, partial [Chloroflexota bacterium]
MAQRTRSTRGSSRSRSKKSQPPRVNPSTLRSVAAVVLILVGTITLIALFLPGGGILNGYVDGFLRPLFGQGAWLLGILLIVAGVLVERAPSVDYSWVTVAIGGLIVFIGGQGLIHLFSGKGDGSEDLKQGGGALGELLSSTLSDLVSPVGAFVILAGIVLVGILLLFNITLVAFVSPFIDGGRAAWSLAASGVASSQLAWRQRRASGAHEAVAIPVTRAGRGRRRAEEPEPELPAPTPSPAPVSQTVWTGSGRKREVKPAPAVAAVAVAVAEPPGSVGSDPAAPGLAPDAGAVALLETPALGADGEHQRDEAHPDAAEVARRRLHQKDWRLP